MLWFVLVLWYSDLVRLTVFSNLVPRVSHLRDPGNEVGFSVSRRDRQISRHIETQAERIIFFCIISFLACLGEFLAPAVQIHS